MVWVVPNAEIRARSSCGASAGELAHVAHPIGGSFALKIRVDRGQSVLRLDFDRRLILEFHESRTKLEA